MCSLESSFPQDGLVIKALGSGELGSFSGPAKDFPCDLKQGSQEEIFKDTKGRRSSWSPFPVNYPPVGLPVLTDKKTDLPQLNKQS
ncbi:hypothetical protein Y1Q_0007770 [Alligator mississippiensis]|uniref:Uncharacterized protein n=1 Tax=Alligator mississippiensis TaxID=8496 RepID=A0A151N743_ALLMI|nr:hypothetical protein Y1Q_0007770 [Alligator mississippiensis]